MADRDLDEREVSTGAAALTVGFDWLDLVRLVREDLAGATAEGTEAVRVDLAGIGADSRIWATHSGDLARARRNWFSGQGFRYAATFLRGSLLEHQRRGRPSMIREGNVDI